MFLFRYFKFWAKIELQTLLLCLVMMPCQGTNCYKLFFPDKGKAICNITNGCLMP